jgi:hypothetical protein
MARVWKTNASINMPVPATTQAMMAPATPVAVANRAGKKNTPAPTIDPTTIAVRVGSVILAGAAVASCSTVVIRALPSHARSV